MEQLRVDLVALNPQPLPPDATIELLALQPQPLPSDSTINLVALNPQPLPPVVRINLVALNPAAAAAQASPPSRSPSGRPRSGGGRTPRRAGRASRGTPA